MKSNHGRRAQRLEVALPHRAIVSRWLAEVQSFDSPREYLHWALADWSTREPIPKLLREALEVQQDERNGSSSELPAGLFSTISAVKFHQTLVWEANIEVDETVNRCRDRLETATAVISLIELFSSLGQTKAFPVFQCLTQEGDVAEPAHQAAEYRALETIGDHLRKVGIITREVLSHLWASKLTAERISEKHFQEAGILHPSISRAMEEVSEAASLCAQSYAELWQRITQENSWLSEQLGESNEIDFKKLKEIAQDISMSKAATLIAHAHSIMLASFGEQAQELPD